MTCLGETQLQDDAEGFPTQHQRYRDECRLRVFGCLILYRQQLSNAMIHYTMDTECNHSYLAFARPLPIFYLQEKQRQEHSCTLGSSLANPPSICH